MNERHFFDFTIHHVDIMKGRTLLDQPQFSLEASTILLEERPDVALASNIRANLNDHLKLSYGIDFNSVQ